MTNPRGAAAGAATAPQQPALLARQDQARAAGERRAVEVVRTWLIERERTWLAVDFTKTRPEPPFDDDSELCVAVGRLPRQAYGSGLDVRGSFIVRLADLNGLLSRAHDDAGAARQADSYHCARGYQHVDHTSDCCPFEHGEAQ
ncbi:MULTISPECIES: hypothetical protein [Mycobacterium avium complex (MAC)]|uniref:hypothetical protein n=1 Tax=Mycobacterium avium complex (MAC) TaxID=120793 RepID=UPI000B15C1A5|nr:MULTISPECIES: hypothetical protein [Mycobacterium avium complex (MAC)]